MGAELFLADRWTGMTKLTVAFRNFVNAPKITLSYYRLSEPNTVLRIYGLVKRVREFCCCLPTCGVC